MSVRRRGWRPQPPHDALLVGLLTMMLVLLPATAGLPGAVAARAAPSGARVAAAAVLRSPNLPAAATPPPALRAGLLRCVASSSASRTRAATATTPPIARNPRAPTP